MSIDFPGSSWGLLGKLLLADMDEDMAEVDPIRRR